ncbi:MAG: CDP-alcohol phosphatidyltransferase family protein [Hyphomicrobiales bacterium]|nr:CDP-alcohol phosphatidyltransferase family protein [Hyphomicrobiales bacterium]
MATLYDLKPRFQAWLRPLSERLVAAGVTANQVTIAAVLLSLGYGALLAVNGTSLFLVGLPIVVLVRMAFNAIDGMMAREAGQQSRLGFFLNEIGDVVSDTALYLPLALLLAPEYPLVIGSMIVAIALTEFAGVLGCAAGGTRRYDGPFGKSDRAVFFSVIAIVAAVFTLSEQFAVAVLSIALLLAVATIINRVRIAIVEGQDGG